MIGTHRITLEVLHQRNDRKNNYYESEAEEDSIYSRIGTVLILLSKLSKKEKQIY